MNFYVMPTEEGLPARAILHGGPGDVVAVWDFAKGWQVEGQELPSELADDITARCARLHVPGFEDVRAPFGHLAVMYGTADYENASNPEGAGDGHRGYARQRHALRAPRGSVVRHGLGASSYLLRGRMAMIETNEIGYAGRKLEQFRYDGDPREYTLEFSHWLATKLLEELDALAEQDRDAALTGPLAELRTTLRSMQEWT